MYDDIIQIVKTLILMDNLNILFIGDSGSGKTAMLNSLVREYYNGIPYKDYKENVLHINSLKELGIQYYRTDYKTFCQTSSTVKNKKKIVILDDIDFINEQSQQVFRNCVDKFSHNVHFIASCSNNQKVIESIQSRFFIIKMKPLSKESLNKIMEKILMHENIVIDDAGKELVINLCNHSAKILMNYLEKFKVLDEKITFDLVNVLCTNISFQTFELYTKCVKERKLNEAIQLLYEVYDRGYSVMDILDSYFVFVKTTKCLTEDEKYEFIPLICKYIAVFHNIHEDEIELALFTNNLVRA